MRAAIVTLTALCGLLLGSGCGSSGGSGASSSSTAATVTVAHAPSGGAPKLDATPRYAAPTSAEPVRSGTVQVAYHYITIAPDTLRVKVGTTIRWTNYDPVEHNVTSQGGPQRFASKDFGKGGTFAIVANRPGVIHYLCTIHPTSMNGTIEVVS